MPKPDAKPEKPDPTQMFAGLTELLDKAGGVGGIDAKFAELEATTRRSRIMNVKLTLLLEHAGIDWESDKRIKKYAGTANPKG